MACKRPRLLVPIAQKESEGRGRRDREGGRETQRGADTHCIQENSLILGPKFIMCIGNQS